MNHSIYLSFQFIYYVQCGEIIIFVDKLLDACVLVYLVEFACRCGLVWLRRAKKVAQMLSKHMFFGVGMNQLKERFDFLFRGVLLQGWFNTMLTLVFFAFTFQIQYYFEGRYNLVKFVKLVGSNGLYLHLRIGPYVCAEWNFGSHPISLPFCSFILLYFFFQSPLYCLKQVYSFC